jgi:hypothetical protein
MITTEKHIDRKHLLYNRKGHKKIGIKNREKLKLSQIEKNKLYERIEANAKKIERVYEKYDLLVVFSIKN